MRLSLLTRPSHPDPRAFADPCGSRKILAAIVSLALLVGPGSKGHSQTIGFPSGCIGYCGNGVAIGIGAIAGGGAALGILLAVNHDRHLLQGCVSTGSDGPQLQTSDAKIYALRGDPAVIKVGDRVKFHGNRMRKARGDKGNQVFKVDKIKKDYGPCRATQTQAAPAAPTQRGGGS